MEYLFDPFGQQSGAKNDRVGDSEHDKIAVGRDASGRLLNKYDERQRVADHADDDDDRTQVDVQLLVKSVCLYVHHPALVRLHVHRCSLSVSLWFLANRLPNHHVASAAVDCDPC